MSHIQQLSWRHGAIRCSGTLRITLTKTWRRRSRKIRPWGVDRSKILPPFSFNIVAKSSPAKLLKRTVTGILRVYSRLKTLSPVVPDTHVHLIEPVSRGRNRDPARKSLVRPLEDAQVIRIFIHNAGRALLGSTSIILQKVNPSTDYKHCRFSITSPASRSLQRSQG